MSSSLAGCFYFFFHQTIQLCYFHCAYISSWQFIARNCDYHFNYRGAYYNPTGAAVSMLVKVLLTLFHTQAARSPSEMEYEHTGNKTKPNKFEQLFTFSWKHFIAREYVRIQLHVQEATWNVNEGKIWKWKHYYSDTVWMNWEMIMQNWDWDFC